MEQLTEEEWAQEGLDPLVIPLVKYFNDNGLKTYMSCQGHGTPGLSMFWISFDSSVEKEDIARFQRNHLNPKTRCFHSCGRFAQRLVCNSKREVWNMWCYFAADPDAADVDLRCWRNGTFWFEEVKNLPKQNKYYRSDECGEIQQ